MKFFKKSTLVVLAMGLMLFACKHENVAPTEGSGSGNPSLAGAVGDPHPALDTICQSADTMYLIREDNMSPTVDKCFTPAGMIPCVVPQPRWGYLEMVEGYIQDTTMAWHNYIDCNFTLAPGWYCDFTNWAFGFGNSFQFDQNGIPIVGTDWGILVVNPVENKWQVRVNVNTLPDPCYDVALRVTAVRLNLFGAVTPNSSTTLWGENDNWDNVGHPAQSSSRWLMRFCPTRCLENQPTPPDTTRECRVVYTGLSCPSGNNGNAQNCVRLVPAVTETGLVSYVWSTGLTTQEINVCPTSASAYTVTVTLDGVAIHVIEYDVHVIDVSCSIPNSGGGGGGGGGYGSGSGCGNGGNGGGSNGSDGSEHHPGCNRNHYNNANCNGGNHKYGCNTSHSGGNSNCNHKGHGYHCTANHPTNKACNGGHTRGCDGQHSASQTCQSRSGHRYNCNGNHTSGNCNTSLYHTTGCNNSNHSSWRGCNNGHAHHGHGNGSGYGSGYNGGHGHTNHVCGGTPPPPPPTPGVKVCHIPPGNPNGATTICVPYSQLNTHVTGVCTPNGGGGNSGGGGGGGGYSGGGNGSNNGSGCGNGGYGNNGSGYGGWNGSGNGCGNNGSNNNGSGNGWNGWNGWNGNGCGNNGGGGNGGGNPGGHPGDMIGACNSNPCL